MKNRSRSGGFGWHLAVPYLLSVWFHVDDGWAERAASWLLRNAHYADRETSIRVHDWAIWWNVWRDDSSWDSSVPRWRNGSFHFLDFVLGRSEYTQRMLYDLDVKIPLPERAYNARLKMIECTWKRPRWFPKRVVCGDIDCHNDPIPHPGKGESEWDCGEDALHSMSTGSTGRIETTVEESVAAVVKYVLGRRRRYGGSVNWKPAQTDSRESV